MTSARKMLGYFMTALAAVAVAVAGFAGTTMTAAPVAGASPCTFWKMNSPKLVLNLANGQSAEFQMWQGDFFSTHDPNATLLHAATDYYGNANGIPVSGNKIDFVVNWADLDGRHITSHFTGNIAEDGTAKGVAVDNRNDHVNWTSQGAFSCTAHADDAAAAGPAPVSCPDGSTVTPPQSCAVAAPPKTCPDKTTVPAGQPCVPPKNAVTLDFARSGFNVKATFSNLSKASGTCHYDAEPAGGTAIGNQTDDFSIDANRNVIRSYPAPLPGSTYHVTVSCNGTYDGQQVEFGHIDKDFDF